MPSLVLWDLADGAVVVEYPDLSEDEANARAVAAARALERQSPGGLQSVVVGARTLFLEFDPTQVSAGRIEPILATRESSRAATPRRALTIPAVYGGEAGS